MVLRGALEHAFPAVSLEPGSQLDFRGSGAEDGLLWWTLGVRAPARPAEPMGGRAEPVDIKTVLRRQ